MFRFGELLTLEKEVGFDQLFAHPDVQTVLRKLALGNDEICAKCAASGKNELASQLFIETKAQLVYLKNIGRDNLLIMSNTRKKYDQRNGLAIDISKLGRKFTASSGILRRRQKVITALDSISLQVKHGECFGFLGPNGAGKTTTIKIMTTLLLPTSGTVRVLGWDVTKSVREVRKGIAFMFGGERGLYWRLSAADNIRYFANLYNIHPDAVEQQIRTLFEIVGLQGREDEKVQGFSRGMKQRLHIARLLISDAEILFLDEPTIGMDPVGTRQIQDLINNLKLQGKTIFLTTHDMLEAEKLCDRIAIIDKGQIINIGSVQEFKKLVPDLSLIQFELQEDETSVRHYIEKLPYTTALRTLDTQQTLLTIQTTQGAQDLAVITQQLGDLTINKTTLREPTLDDVYRRLIGGEN